MNRCWLFSNFKNRTFILGAKYHKIFLAQLFFISSASSWRFPSVTEKQSAYFWYCDVQNWKENFSGPQMSSYSKVKYPHVLLLDTYKKIFLPMIHCPLHFFREAEQFYG